MADKPYSKREIDQIIEAMRTEDNGFKTDIRASLTRIESQTTLTNGRVKRLELWQSYSIGFCACLSLVLFSILVPAAFAFFT